MRRPWTPSELTKLKELYPDHYTKDIAKILNRSISSIYLYANINGLKKSEKFMQLALEREGQKLIQVGQNTRFKKGNIAHNKGQKMDEEIKERITYTFFKKGHEPHNMKYDGHERICKKDGYVYVRIAKGKYVLKHRHIYQQHHGPIEPGMIIIFVDGNKMNFDIKNLKAITKQENAIRNQMHHYPQELKDLIKLKNKLKKTINEKQN